MVVGRRRSSYCFASSPNVSFNYVQTLDGLQFLASLEEDLRSNIGWMFSCAERPPNSKRCPENIFWGVQRRIGTEVQSLSERDI